MAKSLQELEASFVQRQEQGEFSKGKSKKGMKSWDKFLLTSDIVFYIALIGAAISSISLYYGERGQSMGLLYDITNGYREVILVGFLVLFIISFGLKFVANSEKH